MILKLRKKNLKKKKIAVPWQYKKFLIMIYTYCIFLCTFDFRNLMFLIQPAILTLAERTEKTKYYYYMQVQNHSTMIPGNKEK